MPQTTQSSKGRFYAATSGVPATASGHYCAAASWKGPGLLAGTTHTPFADVLTQVPQTDCRRPRWWRQSLDAALRRRDDQCDTDRPGAESVGRGRR